MAFCILSGTLCRNSLAAWAAAELLDIGSISELSGTGMTQSIGSLVSCVWRFLFHSLEILVKRRWLEERQGDAMYGACM
jgi:hypothetical protein